MACSTRTFPLDQIVSASVHDAWVLSDEDEDTFFDIVQQLAKVSAEKAWFDDSGDGREACFYGSR